MFVKQLTHNWILFPKRELLHVWHIHHMCTWRQLFLGYLIHVEFIGLVGHHHKRQVRHTDHETQNIPGDPTDGEQTWGSIGSVEVTWCSILVMVEDNGLGVTFSKVKLMYFEKTNQFSGISKSQLCSASVWNCLAWFVGEWDEYTGQSCT